VKLSLGARLFISYLAVVLTGMLVIAPLAWFAVERLYQSTERANLLAQAQLIAAAIGGVDTPVDPGSAVPYSQTTNVIPGIHTRILDAQGAAVIDLVGSPLPAAGSPVPLPGLAQNAAGAVTPAELLARPEIAQARQGEATTAIRRVEVAGGRPVLYAAAPVVAADGTVAQIVYLASPLPDTRLSALPPALRGQLAGVLLLSALLAGGVGLIFARRIARPLNRLARAAGAVAAGDLTQNVPDDSAIPEVSVVSRAFNTMTASLRRLDQARNAFVADVSHELRTPLTVIKGTVETLQAGAIDDRLARGAFLSSMEREADRMIRLVNDLLVLARADSGGLKLHPQPLDLSSLARERCAALQPSAALRGVQLRVEGSPAPIIADPDRVAQVLDNLLSNAVRHSPAGGEVRVVVFVERQGVSCRVIDCGPGIAPEHLPYLFERFYRADPARDRLRLVPGGRHRLQEIQPGRTFIWTVAAYDDEDIKLGEYRWHFDSR